MKTMLRAYCLETGKEWDEGMSLLLFAARITVQKSMAFSPAELSVWPHHSDPFRFFFCVKLTSDCSTSQNVLDYISSFLYLASEVATETLTI